MKSKDVSGDRLSRVRILFEEVLALPHDARSKHLDEACGEDSVLRQEILTLLKRSDSAEAEFGQLAWNLGAWKESITGMEKPGTQIGPYTLAQSIGEGGFGTVWQARQESPVKRQVALKIIKVGMDTKEVVARFEAERQALALMNHPNIATVFDAGATASGRPFFVMELVEGVPITQYCDQHEASTADRLHLFIKVCRAIQHAHQKGVIHRDLKPSNVMVSIHDDAPVPKIIDFGIAKAMAAPLTDNTLLTRVHTFIGTPVYSSPEQMLGSVDIDTRADIYSLGVLLYELLTGCLPFDSEKLAALGFEEMCQAMREINPLKPSTQIQTLPAEDRTTIGRRRKIEPTRLILQLKGDLDWIVLHCLEKERDRRYESAGALARDIEHHLHHEPIVARPPSTMYRLRKFIRRNKVMMGATAAVAAALVGGITVSTWQAVRATRAERATATAMEREVAARKSAEAVVLEANARKFAIEVPWASNTHGLAQAIAALEREDSPWRRRIALHALWKSPIFFHLASGDGHEGRRGAEFSPDGQWLATGSGGPDVLLWPSDGGQPKTLPGNPDLELENLHYSPSGRMLLAHYTRANTPIFTGPFTQALWDTVSLTKMKEWDLKNWAPFWFAEDESKLLAYHLIRASPYAGFAWWSIDGNEVTRIGSPQENPPEILRFPNFSIINFCYPPSGNLEKLASWQGKDVFVSSLQKSVIGQPVHVGRHDRDIKSVSIDPTGSIISSASEKELILWSVQDPEKELVRLPANWGGGLLDFPHSRIFAGWPNINSLTVAYDLRGPVATQPTPLLPMMSGTGELTVSPDGHWVAQTTSSFGDRYPALYNMRAIRPFHVEVDFGEESVYNCLRFSPDMKQLAVVTESGRILLFDLTAHELPPRVVFESPNQLVIMTAKFDPKKEVILVGTHRAGAWLAPLDGGEPIFLENAPSMTASVAFSPSGNLIAVGGGTVDMDASERFTRVLDRNGQLIKRLEEGATEGVEDLHFIAEKELIVSTDKALRIWNIESNEVTLLQEGMHREIDVSDSWIAAIGDKAIWLYDRETLIAKKLVLPVYSLAQPVAISPDERFIVTREPLGGLFIQYVDEDRYHLLPMEGGSIPADIWIDPRGYWIASINGSGILSYWPVPRGEPLHDRPLEELLEILKAQTNFRVFMDPQEEHGYRYVSETFPGWDTIPVWQEWYSEAYMQNIPWKPLLELGRVLGIPE